MLTEYRFKKIIEKVIKESLGAVRLGDIAEAVVQSVGKGRAVSPDGRDIFEFLEIGENIVDVEFLYTTYIYRTKGKEYGYYDLPDEPEIVEERTPEVESVEITVDGNPVEDDGTVANTLQTLFNEGRLYVDKSDSSTFLSQREYFGENKTYNNNTNMNKKLIRLTESDLHRIIKESIDDVVSQGGNIHQEYEQLYNDIQSVTNAITNFVGFQQMNADETEGKTNALLTSLLNAASNLSDIAHEVEEHLAWD